MLFFSFFLLVVWSAQIFFCRSWEWPLEGADTHGKRVVEERNAAGFRVKQKSHTQALCFSRQTPFPPFLELYSLVLLFKKKSIVWKVVIIIIFFILHTVSVLCFSTQFLCPFRSHQICLIGRSREDNQQCHVARVGGSTFSPAVPWRTCYSVQWRL